MSHPDTTSPLWLPDPVNRQHPLNRGRVAWHLTLPGLDGGGQWYDLAGLRPGALNFFGAGYGWQGQGTTRPGGWGQLLFNGTNSYVSFPAALTGVTDFTVSAWVRLDAAGNFPMVWTCDSGNFDLRFDGSTRKPQFGNLDALTAVTLGQWYHIAATKSGSNTAIYVNGIREASSTLSLTLVSSTMYWGRRLDGFYFPGALDSGSVWNRGLSDAEVWAEYESSRRGYPGVLNRVGPSVFLLSGAGGGAPAPSAATFAVTLGDATLSASAVFSAPSALAATLAPATLSASAAFSTPSTFAATLAPATLAATATFATPTALAATLAPATFAATATFATPTALAATLADATLAASASFVPAGGAVLAATLAPATLAATATFGTAAAFAPTLAPATLSATATFATTTGLAATLAPATLAAHATVAVPSAFAATLAPATLAATAVWAPPDPAALAATLGAAVLVALAHAAPPGQVTCSLAAQLEDATLVATARCRWLPGDLVFVTNFGNTIYPLMDWSVKTTYPMPDWTIETRYPER